MTFLVVLLGLVLVFVVWATYWQPIQRRLEVTWGPDEPPDEELVFLKRRRFPWPTTNTTLWSWASIYDGGELGMNDTTLAGELGHIYNRRTEGLLWCITHRAEDERRAHRPRTEYPKYRYVDHG